MSPPVGAVEPHRHEPLRSGHVDPVRVAGEMRTAGASGRADQGRIATVGGYPDKVEPSGRPEIHRAFHPLSTGRAKGHDSLAVGRPNRVAIECRGPREPDRLAAAIAGPLPDLASLRGPAHVCEPFAIGRPARVELTHTRCRDRLGLAIGQVHDVKPRQGGKRQMLAIRRRRRALDQP